MDTGSAIQVTYRIASGTFPHSPFRLWHNASRNMQPIPRHQCLIYHGPPSHRLPMLAIIMRQKMRQNHRCIDLNSASMVASMRSALEAAGVDVAQEVEATSLILSSSRDYLIDGKTFDVDRMMGMLEDFLQKSLVDGYAGLWATGDMTWELGPERDFSNLVEYEWRLEEFLRTHAQIGCICQYRADALPQEALRKGLLTHRGVFISETLSMVNPHYLPAESFPAEPARELELDIFLNQLCSQEFAI